MHWNLCSLNSISNLQFGNMQILYLFGHIQVVEICMFIHSTINSKNEFKCTRFYLRYILRFYVEHKSTGYSALWKWFYVYLVNTSVIWLTKKHQPLLRMKLEKLDVVFLSEMQRQRTINRKTGKNLLLNIDWSRPHKDAAIYSRKGKNTIS